MAHLSFEFFNNPRVKIKKIRKVLVFSFTNTILILAQKNLLNDNFLLWFYI